MQKRVYGVLGISSIMANWNADFSGYPKSTTNGETFGSDKALKYPMKKLWETEGEKVLYIKSMRLDEGKNGEVSVIPRTLKERYQQLFNIEELKDCKDMKDILHNLFSAIDVKNFGATFAEEGNNISITGAVQFGQGFNKYEETMPQEQPILSPFRDPNAKAKSAKKSQDSEGEEAKNSTLGTKIVSDEAHYFYSFSINPKAYKDFVEMGVTDGYTEEDYKKFKAKSLTAATAFDTNAKAGCDNEFGLFVETEENVYLPNFSEYIEFVKEEKNQILLEKVAELLNAMGEKISNIEIYYNPYTTNIVAEIDNAKLYNIFTMQEI